jgi:Domain of unknown function (DUF4345)
VVGIPSGMTGIAGFAIWASAAFYAAIGAAALIEPRRLLRAFGIRADTVDAANEVRAVYGGFPLALAGLLGFAALGGRGAEGIVLAAAASSFGMAAGRIVSALADRKLGRAPALFLALEILVGGVLVFALG